MKATITTVDDCEVIQLPRIERAEGNITPVEAHDTVPFGIARAYHVYDIYGGADRGGHAHRKLEQLIVAAMGSFTVIVDDGESRREIELNRAYHGLFVPTGIWREMVNFSSGGICLVLASMQYAESDYIRDYDEFLTYRASLRAAAA